MKFTNGFWLVREGYTIVHPAEVYEAVVEQGKLTVYAPVKRVRHRGDTLNSPVLTYELDSPAPDVLRVRISHFRGGSALGPHFQITDLKAQVQVQQDEKEASITSGRLTARFRKLGFGGGSDSPWKLEFFGDGKLLTASEDRGAGYVRAPDGCVFMKEELSLDAGEYVYGLGERFSAFVKNGQSVDVWNEDGGTASEQTYKNIPFYLTNRGYGVFVNHPERVMVEAGSEKVSRVQFSVQGESLEYYVFFGPSPKEIVSKYTALTGRPALPPAWSFGLWLTTSFTTSYDEETVTGFIRGMADRDLPLSVFHFDCFWMKGFHWCDFLWDSETFPDPKAMLKRLKARGLKICVWINSYIAQNSAMFEEGKRGGYLVKKSDGGVWQTDLWQAGMGLVDFTNPKACLWYEAKLAALLDMGVDCFKTDFGERIPTDVVWHDGSDAQKMHNYYTYLYNQSVFGLLQRKRGEGEAAVFARSATVGGQKFPVHWGGDSNSSYPSMAESLRGGLSLGLSGFGFWSHDIGGFEGTPPEDLFHRWVAFGLLSSHSRLHGSSSVRVPWAYGDRAVEVLRFFTKLKLGLMPYLYQIAVEAVATGLPVLRAALLEFPDDPASLTLDLQYFLGDRVLVAPIFHADGSVDVWIPAGTWTHLLTGETAEGPRWHKQTYDSFGLPLYARPGSLIPFTTETARPDADWHKSLLVKTFVLEDGKTAAARIVDQKGKDLGEIRVTKRGGNLEVTSPEAVLPYLLESSGETMKVTKASQTF